MFCGNCGNQIVDGQVFCANCGNRVGAGPIANPNMSRPNVNIPRPNIPTPNFGGMSVKSVGAGNSSAVLYLAVAVAQILELIFWFCPFVGAEVFGYKLSFSMHGAYVEGNHTFTSVLTIIFMIMALLCIGAKIINFNAYDKIMCIVAATISGWTMGLVVHTFIKALGEELIGVTFWAVLLSIISIAIPVFWVIEARKASKKYRV